MKPISFAGLPTQPFKLPVKFETFDPATGEGFLDLLKVDIDIPVDADGMSPVNGDYTLRSNDGDIAVTYWRVDDVDFAPFRVATLNCCSGMGYQVDDIQTKLDGLSFRGQYALPPRFDGVVDIGRSVHSVTGKGYCPNHRNGASYEAATLEDIHAFGRTVVDYEKRTDAIREAASRCFLIRRDVGLCMAAEQPNWGVSGSNGQPTVNLYAVSPNRRRNDVFGLGRRDEAIAFARTLGAPEPLLGGEIHRVPHHLRQDDDVEMTFAAERGWFSRILSRNVTILDAEGVAFMHDCHQGAGSMRGYGSAGDMLALIERVRESLMVRPDERRKWEDETRSIRHRLVFEAEHAPAPIEGPRP